MQNSEGKKRKRFLNKMEGSTKTGRQDKKEKKRKQRQKGRKRKTKKNENSH